MKSFFILSYFFLSIFCVIAQHGNEGNYTPQQLIEDILPIQNMNEDDGQLYENIALYLANPIDLNKATDEQLRSLFILNERQIDAFINYREKQGGFLSKYELQVIPGFDPATLKKISPLITLNTEGRSFKSILKRIFHEKNNYLIVRLARTLENKKGYNTDSGPAYEGPPYQTYTRFRVAKAGDFSIGFTLENDAGENFKWIPTQQKFGFDYASGHLQVLNVGRVKNVIVGDYQAQFGQGLLLGGGFSAGKGAEPITTVRKSNIGFIPYTSLNESGFLRGIAWRIEPIKKITWDAFFSYNGQDGNTFYNEPDSGVSAIASSGLHRTSSEIKNRKSFNELNYGTVISYKTRQLETGIIFHKTHLSIPLIKTPRPYNQFSFNGDENTNLSLFLNYTWDNFSFFGEVATSLNQGTAYILGLATSLSPRFDLAVLHRKYDRNFYTFYGRAFAENTIPQNESGYYIGWKYTMSKKYVLTGYIDFFQFPWLRYRGYSPSSGREWLVRFLGKPSKAWSFYFQIREEVKIRNLPSSNLFPTGNGAKHNYWLSCEYTINPHIKFKSRIQYSTYDLDKQVTGGIAIIQDMTFKMGKFSLSLRHAFFDTDNYENRQYVYEKNVWLAYSFPSYYGTGIRNYVLLRYTMNRKIDFWVRWARTYYTHQTTIGSGNETIEGNEKNDITFQARIKF